MREQALQHRSIAAPPRRVQEHHLRRMRLRFQELCRISAEKACSTSGSKACRMCAGLCVRHCERVRFNASKPGVRDPGQHGQSQTADSAIKVEHVGSGRDPCCDISVDAGRNLSIYLQKGARRDPQGYRADLLPDMGIAIKNTVY